MESAKKPRESRLAMTALMAVESIHAAPVPGESASSQSPATKTSIAARRASTPIADHTTATRTRLGTTLRIASACTIVVCAMTAATSQAAATYQGGPTNGASCGLLRDDDNAVEGAEIDGRLQDGGLIE